jgi:hypothetical protein
MTAISLSDYRNLLYTILTAEQAADPTLLRKVYRTKPGGIGETPVAWIGSLAQNFPIDAGIDTTPRIMQGEIIVAGPFPVDLTTTADPFDALYTALVNTFMLRATTVSGGPGTILDLLTITMDELAVTSPDGKTTTYQAMTLLTQYRIHEGRN